MQAKVRIEFAPEALRCWIAAQLVQKRLVPGYLGYASAQLARGQFVQAGTGRTQVWALLIALATRVSPGPFGVR